MSAPPILSLFYTHGLRGDFAHLPRLATRLRALMQDQPAPLLLDLGDSCAAEVWHCAATEGRSALLALDALGYHAANASALSAPSRDKLAAQVSLGLVGPGRAWRYAVGGIRDEGLLLAHEPTPALHLCIVCAPAEQTMLADGVLFLSVPPPGQVGQLVVDWRRGLIVAAHTHPVPPDMSPDISVLALLEMIEEEAHSYRKRG